MIEIRNISKKFGKSEVLKNINLTCEAGQCIALIGPNGCGKTTLIKCILGMVIPTQGEIYFQGKDIAGKFEYRHKIGYMPQVGRYPDNMSIGQVFDMIKDIRGTDEMLDEDLVTSYALQDMRDKQMRTLSGGTVQKVSAALSFLFSPEVLILDEPTAGLDPVAAEILKEKIIKEKEMGKLVLITSHLLSELDELVTHVVLMQDGEIGFHLPVLELKSLTKTESLARAITFILKNNNV